MKNTGDLHKGRGQPVSVLLRSRTDTVGKQPPKIEDHGISRKQSSRWQKLAKLRGFPCAGRAVRRRIAPSASLADAFAVLLQALNRVAYSRVCLFNGLDRP